jgi:hypothetical protein
VRINPRDGIAQAHAGNHAIRHDFRDRHQDEASYVPQQRTLRGCLGTSESCEATWLRQGWLRRQSLDWLSALGYRVFGQNLSDPLERFLRRCLRRHPFADDVSLGSAPNLLGSHLGKPGVEG